jgi:hypothetical protein
MLELIRETITEFCLEFLRNPYLCYTEHGQHALFYSMLLSALPEEQRYLTWNNQKVCVPQKEYPTAGKLGKPQRQHWDIAVLKNPPESLETKSSYDYLKLFAAIEFGMNEAQEHLEDDIERLCHPEANLEYGFVVHLYRLSKSGNPFSSRDWSPKSPRILSVDEVGELSVGKSVEVFYGLADSTGDHEAGVWDIRDGKVSSL